MKKLKDQLLDGEKEIGIWGIGYIGYSSMTHFAREGVKCIGTDIDKKKVEDVNKGNLAIPNIEYWLGFDVRPLARLGMIRATDNWQELISKDIAVHLICIPTEKGGEPYYEILRDVTKKICNIKKLNLKEPPLVIIESTITPNCIEDVVLQIFEDNEVKCGKDILLGTAPRRDWFVSPEKNLKTLPRVIGGTTRETTDLMAEVLGIVCKNILKATDHRHACLVKSIENAYRQVEIALANELSLAYPDINMIEVLKLVGTKWNVDTYHPSFGAGGYCIPLAPKYVLAGSVFHEKLNILKSSIDSNNNQPFEVVRSLEKRGIKKVGILGLCYKGDLKVDILSPTISIVKGLKERGIDVKVHDPYYTDTEIKRILGSETFEFPEGMNEFETILIVADHMIYKSISHKKIRNNLKKCKLILDNIGIWRNINFKKIEYHEAGDKGWLGEIG